VREKRFPVRFYPLQMSHGLARDKTPACAVRGHKLTLRIRARPYRPK